MRRLPILTASAQQADARTPGSTGALRAPLLLIGLLMLLLCGLPQLGIALSNMDTYGESVRPVRLSRSLLMDKLLPKVAAVTPPTAGRESALADVPPAQPLIPRSLRQVSDERFERVLPLRELTHWLYQHDSSFV